jgi:hypothetical protein
MISLYLPNLCVSSRILDTYQSEEELRCAARATFLGKYGYRYTYADEDEQDLEDMCYDLAFLNIALRDPHLASSATRKPSYASPGAELFENLGVNKAAESAKSDQIAVVVADGLASPEKRND